MIETVKKCVDALECHTADRLVCFKQADSCISYVPEANEKRVDIDTVWEQSDKNRAQSLSPMKVIR